MNTKIALIGLCAFGLLLNTGCSNTKATANNSSKPATYSDNNQTLPPVAEAPRRPTWGGNISPYFN
jgi:hypothetical protein